MKKIDLESANEKLNQVVETPTPSIDTLPFELLNRRTNKATKLVANSGDPSPMNGSNRWYDYEFSEPVFLCEVSISAENYRSYDAFEMKWELAQGGVVKQDISRETDTVYRARINQLVKSVSFRPPKKMFSKTSLNSVSLIGFQAGELEEFISLVARLDRFKADITSDSERAINNAEDANTQVGELRTERDDLNTEVRNAQEVVTDLNNQIGRLTEERNGIIADVKKREETATALFEQEALVKERISERNAASSALANEIGERKRELRALQDDINMFPTEISGFVSQASKNTNTYWWLSLVPMALIVIMATLLVSNAANLTTVIDEYDNARILSILATRIPYVVIATAIIGACYKLAAMFVGEIMRINQQRLNLSKVSIIATDVSKASEEGLVALSDEEIYSLRTRLKMDMLRDHMKDYLSRDFVSLVASKHGSNRVAKNEQQSDSEEDVGEAQSET